MEQFKAKVKNIKNNKWYFVSVVNHFLKEVAVREKLEDRKPLIMNINNFDIKNIKLFN